MPPARRRPWPARRPRSGRRAWVTSDAELLHALRAPRPAAPRRRSSSRPACVEVAPPRPSGALTSMLMTIGAPHRWVTPCSRDAPRRSCAGSTRRRQTWVPACSVTAQGNTSRCSGTSAASTGRPGAAACSRRSDVADRVQVGAAVVVDDALGIAGRARGVVERDRLPFVGRVAAARSRGRPRRAAPRSRARRAARPRRPYAGSSTSITSGRRPSQSRAPPRSPARTRGR